MEELDIALVTKRSVRGIFALVSRTFVMQSINFSASFLLTIFLSPQIFGVFFVVSAAIAFLSYFSDIGLAAALIQKKEPIREEDLRTTFTIQQALVLTIAVIAFLASGAFASFYQLEKEGILLFQALIVSFFLSSLKTIPSILLERSLRFEKLVIPQIIETLVFGVTSVLLAYKGFGITSFTIAVLARGLAGVVTIYIVNPWKVRFGFNSESAKKLLSYGVPFQANSLLALLKDDLLIAYLGKVLPLAQVGYVGFAQKWAFTPLRLVMDNIIRITFPSFSRLQNDKDVLGAALEKSLFAACFVIFPSLVGLVLFSPYFTQFLPKYEKWEPALLSLGFFAVNAGLSSVSTPLTNALNAIGKVKITLYLMIFWTISTWVLTPLLIIIFGFNGVSIASAAIATSLIVVVYIAKKYIEFNFLKVARAPFLASFLMGLLLYIVSSLVISNFPTLILMIIGGAILYLAIMFILARKEILFDIELIKKNLKR